MSKGGKPQYSFPTLSHDDILQTLQEMDFPVTQEDLEAPKVRGVLERGTVPLMNAPRAVCVGVCVRGLDGGVRGWG